MAGAKGGMSSPYATIHDPAVYESRPVAVVAPWFKDEPEILTGRSHDPDAFMPCNSQTAPFATFHNVPRSYERSLVTSSHTDLKAHRNWDASRMILKVHYLVQPTAWSIARELLRYIGPLPEAPWNKEIPVHPTHRGQQARDQYYQTTPFGTSDNYQPRPTSQISGVVEDAPWDKKLPDQLPGRGSGVHERSALPSSQTAPFATTENSEEQKQYDGPMPDAPWDKDQRPAYQQKVPPEEYFKNVPYGTSENMDHQEKSTREIDVAPWNKVQPAVMSGKTCYDCGGSANSHTAPYATFDNSTTLKPNKKAGFQAPWDRDEVHYNRLPPKPLFYSGDDGPFNAPYATEPR